VNLTVAPGYVSEATATFREPGEYLVVCNEYCGLGHHNMQGTIVVEAAR
jgi:cytochrome c oxidase subunit 2